ncbi:hypothetical protein GmRootV59_13270 [Variovorax sp. V59]|uniref:hypothetical protein n=1 Tax=unclassified Variovorax TaxID=663243 RepID=UPI0034E8B1E4
MSYVHRCMIVPAAQVELARELVLLLAGEPAANMFTTGLSADGDVPFSHYISTGMIEEPFAVVLADPVVMASQCVAAGRPITALECTDLLAACNISEGEPHECIAMAGLAMLTPEELAARQAARDAANA